LIEFLCSLFVHRSIGYPTQKMHKDKGAEAEKSKRRGILKRLFKSILTEQHIGALNSPEASKNFIRQYSAED